MTTLVAAAGAVATFTAGDEQPFSPVVVSLGPLDLALAGGRPSNDVLLAAVLTMVTIAAGAVALEVAGAIRLLHSQDRRRLVAVMPAPPREPTGEPVHITILIPAHNEEATLPTTLAALREQRRAPDRIVVVADNCTDRTVAIASEFGVEAFETVDNAHRKGGALNQALAWLLPDLGPDDAVMVMDADTTLGPDYLETAARCLDDDATLEAVGGLFFGEPLPGLIGLLQRNEYTRYSREIARRSGRVFVLTGTASVFRAETLRAVAEARGVCLPGGEGQVYDTDSLTEDNELTIALKSLGAPMRSPRGCSVVTELMPTWRNLWKQRLRWQRGALENVAAYGITTATARYWAQQVGIAYGAIALYCYLALMLVTALAADQLVLFVFWGLIGAIFVAERTATVWSQGWRSRVLAAVILPELLYAAFLQAVFVRGLFDILVARHASWGHVQHVVGGASA
jgi:cellulose synthase/poly-beta-1,6-N-acetylglucosamine synthase-like glycosyltransferase